MKASTRPFVIFVGIMILGFMAFVTGVFMKAGFPDALLFGGGLTMIIFAILAVGAAQMDDDDDWEEGDENYGGS